MSRRNKIIIAVAVIVAILIIVIIALSVEEEAPIVNNTNEPSIDRPAGVLTNLNANVNLPQTPKESKEQSNLQATALTFAEKFGSYSNQAGFENLSDLKVMMTPKMQVWADNYIANSIIEVNAPYLGYTTKALNASINYQLEDAAEVAVTTQRSESQGTSPQPRIFYQNILLKFSKLDGAWKVENASWQ